jgi:hypothetical protein
MTTEASHRAAQVRLEDVVTAAMAGVARAIQTHGAAPGHPPIYVGIVAALPAHEAAQAQAQAVGRPPTFVGIVAAGVQARAQPQAAAEAQLPGLPPHTFVGIRVEKAFDPNDAHELQRALTNVQQQLQ